MRDISSTESLTIPDGVEISLKARTIVVEGARGRLEKRVAHIQMDLQLVSQASRFESTLLPREERRVLCRG